MFVACFSLFRFAVINVRRITASNIEMNLITNVKDSKTQGGACPVQGKCFVQHPTFSIANSSLPESISGNIWGVCTCRAAALSRFGNAPQAGSTSNTPRSNTTTSPPRRPQEGILSNLGRDLERYLEKIFWAVGISKIFLEASVQLTGTGCLCGLHHDSGSSFQTEKGKSWSAKQSTPRCCDVFSRPHGE